MRTMERGPAAVARLNSVRVALAWIAALVAGRLGVGHLGAVEATWNHAVEISATVATRAPWRITLTWPEDTGADAAYAPTYTVYRKTADGTKWSEGTVLPARQTTFVDDEVTEGTRYEYCVYREFRRPNDPGANHDGYGYIEAGINVPFAHERARVLLVVEQSAADHLSDKIVRLQQDLIGDGWRIGRIDVLATASPVEVRTLIQQEHEKAPIEALFLLGRVPVARSGNFAPDFHELRPMPADAYYGDIDGKWLDENGDGIFDGNVIPSDIELQVGRVDFAGMADVGTGKTELELLARYLDKNHAFRHAVVRPPRRGIVADRIGVDRGRAPAASAYRALATFFGPENVQRANTEDHGDDDARLQPVLTRESYLWAFGSGGGAVDAIAFMGRHGEYKQANSSDFAAGAKATFYLFFGSYFVDWSQPNNLMRAALASPTQGLTATWVGRPSIYFHHMALGGTIGHGIRLSLNNDGFYYSPGFPTSWRRHVHVALMGDPTLRLEYVAPVSELKGTPTGEGMTLTWKGSPDAEAGPVWYYVYRRNASEATFRLLTPAGVSATDFTDPAPSAGAAYGVRAAQRVKTSSGTYDNGSQMVFWSN